MKMIDVFNLMAKDEIKGGTEIVIYYDFEAYVYKYHELYQTFLNDDFKRMEEEFIFGGDFLNYNVKLISPKPKKYYLRLNKDDNFSYVNWDRRSSYEFAMKEDFFGYFGYKTKFTQEEIDGCEFLKFVEKYGIKEEAKDDEDEAKND